MKVRRKSVIVDAEQWFPGKDVPGVERFEDLDSRVEREMMHALPPFADPADYGYLDTFLGGRVVEAGDWILTDSVGERYLCKPANFAATYEPVSDKEPG